jgi:hypothetical protein
MLFFGQLDQFSFSIWLQRGLRKSAFENVPLEFSTIEFNSLLACLLNAPSNPSSLHSHFRRLSRL